MIKTGFGSLQPWTVTDTPGLDLFLQHNNNKKQPTSINLQTIENLV